MYRNQKVLVVGMARSGLAAARLLIEAGADVTINDSKPLEEIKGQLTGNLLTAQQDFGGAPQDITSYDLVVMSPGVPTTLPFVETARKAGIKVIGALEVAFQYGKGNYYAITGTNGKTTTTTLTYEIFKAAGREAYAVGNIGNPLADHVLDATEATDFVTEVSSFQLESIENFHPKVAAILNLAPDHLNRHKTMEAYVGAKKRIVENQIEEDFLLLNYDDEPTRTLKLDSYKGKRIFFSKKPLPEGFYVKDNKIVAHFDTVEELMSVEDIFVPGPHNVENVLAAVGIAYLAGVPAKAIREAVMAFKGVEHRIEFVGTYDDMLCYNDSKGTNPESSIVAVQSMTRPTLLIAGGMDKGSVFDGFAATFKGTVKHLILLGETKDKLKTAAESADFTAITLVENMEQAVELAFELGEAGDALLLSPACASWDMYPSFEVRGEHFKSCLEKVSNQRKQ